MVYFINPVKVTLFNNSDRIQTVTIALFATFNNALLFNIFVTLVMFFLVYIFFQFEIASFTIDNAYLILKMVKATSVRNLNYWYWYCQ